MHEAKTHLSKLVERAENGEDIVITRRGEPVARLVPERPTDGFLGLLGVWKDENVRIADDFDEFGPELADMFGLDPD